MNSPLARLQDVPAPHYQHLLADLIRREKPEKVVETGLDLGFGAEYILQALDGNGKGHLWSIDNVDRNETNPLSHPRFTFIHETSRDALPALFLAIGSFDLFVHDSDHEKDCQTFEYEAAWNMVRSGGIIASDDTTWGTPPHGAWQQFLKRHGSPPCHKIGHAEWIRRP